jgi:hypothetical protein
LRLVGVRSPMSTLFLGERIWNALACD